MLFSGLSVFLFLFPCYFIIIFMFILILSHFVPIVIFTVMLFLCLSHVYLVFCF